MNHSNSIEAEIGLCLLFAAVDGEISEEEVGALSEHMGILLGDDFDPMALPSLVEAEMATIAAIGVDEYIERLPKRIPDPRRLPAVRAACSVALADGLAPEEEEIMRQVCEALFVDANAVLNELSMQPAQKQRPMFASGEEHDDPPNEFTRVLRDRLGLHGWVDPMKLLRDAGVHLSEGSALALEHTSPNGTILGLEHHTCDDSVHLRVTTGDGVSTVLILSAARGREADLLRAILAKQADLATEGNESRAAIAFLTAAFPVG